MTLRKELPLQPVIFNNPDQVLTKPPHPPAGSGPTPRFSPRGSDSEGTLVFDYKKQNRIEDCFYEVWAYGPIFNVPGQTRLLGKLYSDEQSIKGHIGRLRDEWTRLCFKLEKESPIKGILYPFEESYDLRNENDDQIDAIWKNLAEAGYKLFNLIFSRTDPGLARIRSILIEALRSSPCVLHFDSPDLFAPWTMLYVPPKSDVNFFDAKFNWTREAQEGFIGYRHWVQHQLHDGTWDPELPLLDNRLRIGLNVDTRIDHGKIKEKRLVQPLRDLVTELTSPAPPKVRTTKSDLADAVANGNCDDQFMCFCCHAVVSEEGQNPNFRHARMELSDGRQIDTGDFEIWLSDRRLPNSVIFIDACQGGQMESMFYQSFGRIMLRNGANCLIGPQLDLPTSFAYQYTKRFLEDFTVPGTSIGEVSRTLAREFADTYRNPLGLMFTLYRGLYTSCVLRGDVS